MKISTLPRCSPGLTTDPAPVPSTVATPAPESIPEIEVSESAPESTNPRVCFRGRKSLSPLQRVQIPVSASESTIPESATLSPLQRAQITESPPESTIPESTPESATLSPHSRECSPRVRSQEHNTESTPKSANHQNPLQSANP
ncbi:hypothetical protein QQF64_008832 [Cirrhinus molitorella]|uniref:Uncharacterized protein n=1 Tax=Cirrhinus molitorella TaxID=172907 RepID=A0ABR3M796_9TELE